MHKSFLSRSFNFSIYKIRLTHSNKKMSSNSYENNFDSKKWIPPLKQQSKSYWFLHSNRGYDFQRELGKFAPLSNVAIPEFDVCVIGAG